ncbi:hypothetical protein UUU_27180 [Klebsiella pneumoniae subsp. pneumoniae DSM 30104 = JCM 1662 = NBRC 14940]|nr:hypothetical protein UUU_27180 [Klebsiella pneumoniae subsp. pneumoniae DSM 30104 = JCM 1662 = NBRC 14940]
MPLTSNSPLTSNTPSAKVLISKVVSEQNKPFKKGVLNAPAHASATEYLPHCVRAKNQNRRKQRFQPANAPKSEPAF